MRITVINQPLNNRGDEAAHRSLMCQLNNQFPEAELYVLFVNSNQDSVNQFKVNAKKNKYLNFRAFDRGSHLVKYLGLRFNLLKLSGFHPAHRQFLKYLKETDLVLCAPGGICMGKFQNWAHIYWLSMAGLYKKKIAYYSRSFGPFPVKSKKNRLFKNVSYKLLHKFDFLSIRDAKTMDFADELGISYIRSIDTAFLDTPRINLSSEILDILGTKKFIIFVPNKLDWHPTFVNCDADHLMNIYSGILEMLLGKYRDSNVVMLPQLFNTCGCGDEHYFHKLKKIVNSNRIIVMPEQYGSDIQQTIISKASLMIGARYHSVVFAINNETPFIALSYEHKMVGLLQILGLDKYLYDIESWGEELPSIPKVINEIISMIPKTVSEPAAKEKSRIIALECLNKFIEKYSRLKR